MKSPETIKEQSYIFTTSVTEAASKDEFVIELFPYCQKMDCEGSPLKVLNGFDELIAFFEEMDLLSGAEKAEMELEEIGE